MQQPLILRARDLSPDKLRALTDDEARQLLYDWPLWARPNQLPPQTAWRIFMFCAGRGAGKTRSAAEWVRQKIRSVKYVHLIGATADNARDIMIEGDSGVLSICPNEERPIYKKGVRKLVWPNGAESLIFSAEEPDRLRGIQSHGVWMDELACLIGGSLVSTACGNVPIEQVRIGMRVHTRDGLRRVTNAWKSSDSAEIYRLVDSRGAELIGTGNHPVFIPGRGFIPLAAMKPGDELCHIQSLSGAASVGISGPTTTRTEPASYSIARSTWTRMARSIRTSMSTIATAIGSTTISTISSLFREAIIYANTGHEGSASGLPRSAAQSSKLYGLPNQRENSSAPNVANPFTLPEFGRSTAADLALTEPSCGGTQDTRPNSVVSVEKLGKTAAVYNLSVEGAEEYFANGILVHNSWQYAEQAYDQAMLGLRLGKNPQAIITTTPRPIPIIRELLKKALDESSGVLVTRGSTYDNRDNLAPGFFTQIITKYEGTRLGRQELNAELLDDNPNALWQRSQIDVDRVKTAPLLKRIIVSVDVAVTSGEDSAYTGIVVAGVGEDGHGYVLEDLSMSATPDEWCKVVVDAYRRHRADRVIGEVNNGGDLIEALLRTHDRNISYKSVRATRGKALRAEPIAAVYEQHRVHHVGSLPKLEDEMVNFDPGLKDQNGRVDRVDAVVWAFTELFIEEPAEGGDVFKRKWRNWIATDPPACSQVLQSLAVEIAEETMQWSLTTWGVFLPIAELPRNSKLEEQDKKPNVILLAHDGGTGNLEQTVKQVRLQYEKYKPAFLIVAGQPSTKPVVRHLWRERLSVKRMKYDDAVGPQIGAEMLSAGMAWAPKKQWAVRVAQEVQRYPFAERKATVHSVSLALQWLRHMGDVHPIFDPDEVKPKRANQFRPIYG